MDSASAFVASIANFLDNIIDYGIVSFLMNMLVASASSFISCKLFPDVRQLKRKLEYIKLFGGGIKLSDTVRSNLYDIKYSVGVGFCAAMVVEFQFKSFSYFYSFAYGIAGPYAIKEQIRKHLISKQMNNIEYDIDKSVNKELDAYDEVIEKTNSELEKIRKESTEKDLKRN